MLGFRVLGLGFRFLWFQCITTSIECAGTVAGYGASTLSQNASRLFFAGAKSKVYKAKNLDIHRPVYVCMYIIRRYMCIYIYTKSSCVKP